LSTFPTFGGELTCDDHFAKAMAPLNLSKARDLLTPAIPGLFLLCLMRHVLQAVTVQHVLPWQAVAPLNLFEVQDLLTPAIVGCNISVYYYGGFCYLMQRRYLDAARAFNTILAFIHRYIPTFHAAY